MSIKTSIIMAIANFDYPPAHYTGSAIGSIKGFTDQEKTPYELIVVDNGSNIELGGVKWDEIADKYIRNETNLGVSKAWNQGISAATGDLVCIVNSDIQVFDHWLEDLQDSLKYVDFVMAYPMYDMPYGRRLEAIKRRGEWLQKEPGEYLKDFHDFSCFLASKKLFDIVGPFNEEIELAYSEDIDYKMRMRKKQIVYKSDHRVNIHHISSATAWSLKVKNDINLNSLMDNNKQYINNLWKIDEYGVPEFVKTRDYEPRPEELPELQSDFVLTSLETTPKSQDDGYCVRTRKTGDKVYFIKDNKASWIKNPETLRALGFGFDDIKTISHKDFKEFERLEPINLKEKVEDSEVQVEYTIINDQKPILGYRDMA